MVGSPEVEDIVQCESPNVDATNRTQGFWKVSECTWLLSHLSCLGVYTLKAVELQRRKIFLQFAKLVTRIQSLPIHLLNSPHRSGHHTCNSFNKYFDRGLYFWQGYNYVNNSLLSPFIYLTLVPWDLREDYAWMGTHSTIWISGL